MASIEAEPQACSARELGIAAPLHLLTMPSGLVDAERQAAGDAEATSAQRQADEQSWWHGYFVRAGRLGAIRRVKPSEAKVRGAPPYCWALPPGRWNCGLSSGILACREGPSALLALRPQPRAPFGPAAHRASRRLTRGLPLLLHLRSRWLASRRLIRRLSGRRPTTAPPRASRAWGAPASPKKWRASTGRGRKLSLTATTKTKLAAQRLRVTRGQ